MYDIIVIGGGPAGLTAAVYARRAGKSVLILEKAALGGQITWSPKVEKSRSKRSPGSRTAAISAVSAVNSALTMRDAP